METAPEYVSAGPESIDELVEMRMEFLLGIGKRYDDVEAVRRATRAYVEEGFRAGTYAGFLCKAGGENVSTLGFLTYELPPLWNAEPRFVAHVLNMYTRPERRGRGYARGLLAYAISWARERRYDRVALNAMPAGEPLYRSLGFTEYEDEALVLKLK